MAGDNRTLGRFQLTDIPPSQRGIPQIEVTFDIDANGIIDVKAVDKGTGKQHAIKIESGSSLSDEEVERMKNEAELNAEEDNRKKDEVQKLNEADSMVFQTEKQIKEYDDKIDEGNKEGLTLLLDNLKEAIKDKDLSSIDTLMEEINTKWQEVSAKLYEETESPEDSMGGEETKEETKEDATDVEFEEVK
jgi:molecular chaperone DnaK